MSLIQIIILISAGFALTRAIRQYKKGAFTFAWLLFWIMFWVAAAIVAVLPQTADVLARFVGVGRGADVVTYLSLMVLFYLVFRTWVKIEAVEGEITKVVRDRALAQADTELTKR